jgi:hypothetical protein
VVISEMPMIAQKLRKIYRRDRNIIAVGIVTMTRYEKFDGKK